MSNNFRPLHVLISTPMHDALIKDAEEQETTKAQILRQILKQHYKGKVITPVGDIDFEE